MHGEKTRSATSNSWKSLFWSDINGKALRAYSARDRGNLSRGRIRPTRRPTRPTRRGSRLSAGNPRAVFQGDAIQSAPRNPVLDLCKGHRPRGRARFPQLAPFMGLRDRRKGLIAPEKGQRSLSGKKAARSLDAGQAGRAVERPAAPEGARQGRTRRSRGRRRDRARPTAALRFRGVAGYPRRWGRTRLEARPQGKAFPSPLYSVTSLSPPNGHPVVLGSHFRSIQAMLVFPDV